MAEIDTSKSLETLTKALAFVSAISYGIGFVVVNSYLSQFGLSDFNLINARFVFAGILCGIFLFIWWMFVGSYFRIANEVILSIESQENFSRARRSIVLFQLLFAETLHRILMGASLFAIIVFQNFDIYDFPVGLVILTNVLFLNFQDKLTSIFGFAFILAKISIQITIIIIFLIFAERSVLLLALNYFSIFILFVLAYKYFMQDSFSLKNMEQKIYFSIMLLGTIIAFGVNFYGRIKSEYGGGYPRTAHIVMQKRLPDDVVTQDSNNSFSASLINSTDKTLQLKIGANTLSVGTDQISAVILAAKDRSPLPGENFRQKVKDWGRLKYIINLFGSDNKK